MIYAIGMGMVAILLFCFSSDLIDKIETVYRYKKVKKYLQEIVTTQNDMLITEEQRKHIVKEISLMKLEIYMMHRKGKFHQALCMSHAYEKYEHVVHRFHSEAQLTVQDIKNYENFWDEWHGKRKKDIEIDKNMGYTMNNSQKIPSNL